MPYTEADFNLDVIDSLVSHMSATEFFAHIPIEYVTQGVPTDKLLERIPDDKLLERLRGISVSNFLAGLSGDQLREIRARLNTAKPTRARPAAKSPKKTRRKVK